MEAKVFQLLPGPPHKTCPAVRASTGAIVVQEGTREPRTHWHSSWAGDKLNSSTEPSNTCLTAEYYCYLNIMAPCCLSSIELGEGYD